MRVIANRKKKDFLLGFGVKPGHWCPDRCQVVGLPRKESKAYNDTIRLAESRIFDIVHDLHFRGAPVTIEAITEAYDDPRSKIEVLPFFRPLIEQEADRWPDSAKQYWQMYQKLHCFNSKLTFHQVNSNLIREWDAWMARQGLAKSTRNKHHKNFKKFIGIAIDAGIRLPDPYRSFKVERVPGSREALRQEEMNTLIRAFATGDLPEHLHNTLRYFLFACGTGMRFSDIQKLEHTQLTGNQLEYRPHKVRRYKIKVVMNLGEHLMMLINTRIGRVFDVKQEQATNRNLQRIAKTLGIKTHLTFHVARHTYATLFLERGGSPEVLMELMGITKWDTVKVYIHLAEARKRAANKEFDSLFAGLVEMQKC